jgi:hypothetical protein
MTSKDIILLYFVIRPELTILSSLFVLRHESKLVMAFGIWGNLEILD